MNIRMVCALNMFDETEKRGDNIDYDKIGELFGVPMVPTTFTTGRGVEQLFKTVISIFEAANGILPKEQTKLPIDIFISYMTMRWKTALKIFKNF